MKCLKKAEKSTEVENSLQLSLATSSSKFGGVNMLNNLEFTSLESERLTSGKESISANQN